MLSWLKKQYLNPQGTPYRFLERLNRHFMLIMGLMAFFILLMPAFNLIRYNQKVHQYQKENSQLDKTLNQKTKLLYSKQARLQKLHSQDTNIMHINQKLTELFTAHHIENESLLWDFEKGKSITLNLTHRATILFTLIDALSTFPNLRVKELTLSKLDDDRLVRLNLILQLVAIEEE